MPDMMQFVLAGIGCLGTGGLLGVYLTNKREAPKSAAETNDIDWARFQREIARLDAKVEVQDRRIDELEGEVRACHAEKDALSAEVTRLRVIVDQEGQFRQLAQTIVSTERVGDKK